MTLPTALVLLACGGAEKKKDGAPCTATTVCEGLCLVDLPGGLCTRTCGEVACPAGSTCTFLAGDHYCLPDCTENTACRDGYTCVLGVCRPPALVGVACEEAADCASGRCERGVCTDVCAAHDDCSPNTFCVAGEDGTLRCVPVPADGGPGTIGHPCAVESCIGGTVCLGEPEDPEAFCSTTCTSDADCPPSMLCREDETGDAHCLFRSFCEACDFDGQCGFVNQRCVAADPAVATGRGYCSTGCDPAEPQTCPIDSTCHEASFCVPTGQWVPDCAWCTGECGPLGAPEYQCFHDTGACVGDGGLCAPCLHGGQCASGVCIDVFAPGNTTCSAPCDGSDQCPDDYFCVEVTGEDNQCVPRTGSCSVPSGGFETCEFCSELIEDCRRGFCLPVGPTGEQYDVCADECADATPFCPPYQTCQTIRHPDYGVNFRACVPTALNSSCITWLECMEFCPTGPGSCTGGAPAACL